MIHLSEHHSDATPGPGVRVRAPDVKALLAELHARPVSFYRPAIEDQSLGARKIILQDPSGNRVVSCEPADPA